MSRQTIFNEVGLERAYQDETWGGSIHDDKHGIRDWVTFIVTYLGRAVGRESEWGQDIEFVRGMMVKVAALAVATIEAIDRKNIAEV